MEEDKGPINHPQYPGDVGLDVSLPKDLALFPHQTVSVTLTVPPFYPSPQADNLWQVGPGHAGYSSEALQVAPGWGGRQPDQL